MDDLTVEHPDLAEYFDSPVEWPARVRTHVEDCSSCQQELAEMTELRALARALPRSIHPPSDLWSGIVERLETGDTPPAPAIVDIGPARERRMAQPVWRWLAAAAVILVVVTAGTTAMLLRGTDGAAPFAAAASSDPPEGAIGLAAFASAEGEYRMAVESLEAELEARRPELSDETIAIVEQNLAIIDDAIEESRRALAADPTSADLPLLLATVYRQKIELLRQAVDISART